MACCCGHVCASSAISSKNSKNNSAAKSPARNNIINRLKPVKLTTSACDVDAGTDMKMENDEQDADVNDTNTFIKPTHVAPRSFTQSLSIRGISIRQQVEKFGMNSMRRPSHRGRLMRKTIMSQRTLLPKAAAGGPVVTVQLMPATTLSSHINKGEQLPQGNSPKNVIRIVPGGEFQNYLSSLGACICGPLYVIERS